MKILTVIVKCIGAEIEVACSNMSGEDLSTLRFDPGQEVMCLGDVRRINAEKTGVPIWQLKLATTKAILLTADKDG